MEEYYSKIYNLIKDNYIWELIEPERRLIAEFIYNIHARTRRARDATLEINEEVQHDEIFRKKFQYIFPGHNVEEELEQLKKTFQLSNIFGIKIPSYSYDPKMDETVEKLMSYDYYVLKNSTGTEFYTSDHPISQFDTSEKVGIKVTIPLAYDLLLMLCKGEEFMQMYPNQTIPVNNYFVKNANEATIQAANNFIFSRTNDFNLVKKYLEG